ncbi:MAG: hypothetical protein GOMPHAMPRED_007131 [Gomphillus americanus]|uniref:Uncharacterized protein n=1 Tax=Gomphillus americanus TaxID=1940652 RepID=A0A8H3IYM8_9LECA|nr:MAG: hypothetical protein GOMPHAMPRED_007131 [Gomphillus americanus]
MKSIFIFVICSVGNLALALIDLDITTSGSSRESQLRGRSKIPNYNKSRGLNTSCGGALQRRGQCFAKSDKDRKPRPVQNQPIPVQSPGDINRIKTTSDPQKPGTQQFRPLTNAIQNEAARTSGRLNRHGVEIGRTSGTSTPLTVAQLSRHPSGGNYLGLSQSAHRSVRHSLLSTGATGISTIGTTQLGSTSSGSVGRLSFTERNDRRLRPPTAKVKIRGPGFIEVDNSQGEPRNTALQPGERGRDAMRDHNGAQSIAFTNPGGKSRSRGKGGLVTAKVNKHGTGTATIRIADQTRTTEEIVDHRSYGTRTFIASSDDPANPATIKVKAAGSVYTSMMVQNKPAS